MTRDEFGELKVHTNLVIGWLRAQRQAPFGSTNRRRPSPAEANSSQGYRVVTDRSQLGGRGRLPPRTYVPIRIGRSTATQVSGLRCRAASDDELVQS